ncbi:PQQ-binding-like beta-propeller repeat protein [Aurantiacibacter sp. MUD11]|uniref:outer membrane protein assembly factor BamB family protein n=1 Tax=Aurantiacibacter sp. MUD11 TaxID=3003265 RepID=UPI0022AAAA55|nr:PQQ-binding-like beta-propeller repeat protein [Aurantiacibacter sp. MUD11]WAT18913.1 PQQ-binding-like beta-propeller repeat protein [Aurantiacibacter sp. MUD11]
MRAGTVTTLATLLACTTACTTASLSPLAAQEQGGAMPDGDWQTIHRDLASTRFSPLADINRANVGSLQQAWAYPYRAFNNAVPLVIDGIMYFPAQNRIVALDAATGEEVWVHTHEFPASDTPGPPPSFAGRGLGYWPGDGTHGARLLVTAGSMLMAFDMATGEPIASFGDNGAVAIDPGYSGTPTITGNTAIIGAASLENPQGAEGNPRGFDVITGEKLWEFDTTPDAGQPYNETWGDGWVDRGGTNMWGFAATVDESTGTAYLPIAGPAHNYYGGDRPGTNVYGNSVVAVDARTGEYKWHFQTVHHDLWDIDMSHAGPLLPVTTPDGQTHQVLANVGKSSMFFVLDAEDGEPVHPVEERRVPPGDVPGEYYHPTQPFPVVTPPLSRVEMTYQDIVGPEDTTPEHSEACYEMWDAAGGFLNLGPYTPFMYRAEGQPPRSTIQLPGGIGGVNWGGPAADPTTGMVYVNALDTSLVGWVEKVEGDQPYSFDATQAPEYDRASVNGKGPFFSFSAPLSGEYDDNGRPVGPSLPCYKPPWARLTAVDANTGEIAWAVPLGQYDELPEGRRVLGNAGSAGPTVTAGGLVFVGATNDRRFRAFDADSGEQLWEVQLQGNANANPFSYRGSDGRQYVAINASGQIVAFALEQ